MWYCINQAILFCQNNLSPIIISVPSISFRIADWLSKQSERDQEKARRKQERLERLQTAPKHVFEDSTAYTSQLQDNMDSIDDALQNGYYTSFLTSYCKLIKMYKNTAQQPII
jgi:hypothetical protein